MPIHRLPQSQTPELCIDYACELMARESVTPTDSGCQDFLARVLSSLGFDCMQTQVNGVSNLIARIGEGDQHVAFSGHTDVVSPGLDHEWYFPPFQPTIDSGVLYGRGAADMKTGVAAMLAACHSTQWRALNPDCSFWFLITSDEEGEAEFGSAWIAKWLAERDIQLNAVIVGEPTAIAQAGDAIKVGRRGSLSATITVRGKQGHVAYPHNTVNALHIAAKIATALSDISFEAGSADFPGTTLQVTHVDSGEHTDNIVPGCCHLRFNVRYADEYCAASLKAKLTEIVDQHAGQYDIAWERPCEPYFSHTRPGHDCLVRHVEQAVHNVTGRYPLLSTAGGTSDGRFFAGSETQVVEVGVPNRTIHQVNECVDVIDIVSLTKIYQQLLSSLLFR
ncbi:succinyl-diaminopimelate desuccinylase [Alteromonas oceanisediminis]|uniref:succinyl-diaminopimelate desuccinylase n=1 Tax=Alteromonas oceanisediminis TaxID=2836180 RepID=UPI001BDA8DFF|nr:succinyl-diaminopimelate desuccinylase [Alteromonas oceanisediminis]MBT0585770.1 succinyl-diaminopimelate desuccinylase [Alteromonas oceanisediminis]